MTGAPEVEQDRAAVQSLCMALHAPGPAGEKNEPVRYDVRGRRMLCAALNRMVPGSSRERPKYLPNDGAVDSAVSLGIRSGMVRKDGSMISLTEEGARAAAGAWEAAGEPQARKISALKELYGSFTDDEALVFSYCDCPPSADAAGERAELDRLRIDCAVSMFVGEKISFGRATEVSGLGYVGLLEEVKRRGIPPFVCDEETYALTQRGRDILARQ